MDFYYCFHYKYMKYFIKKQEKNVKNKGYNVCNLYFI